MKEVQRMRAGLLGCLALSLFATLGLWNCGSTEPRPDVPPPPPRAGAAPAEDGTRPSLEVDHARAHSSMPDAAPLPVARLAHLVVRDERGAPVEDARLLAPGAADARPLATTDPQGRLEVAVGTDAEWSAELLAPDGYVPARLLVWLRAGDEREARLTRAAPASWVGLRVVDRATGEAVPHFALRYRGPGGEPRTEQTDDEGVASGFAAWAEQGNVWLLDWPDAPRERWRAAPRPARRGRGWELFVDVGPTWPVRVVEAETGAPLPLPDLAGLEAWLQVAAERGPVRPDGATVPVREGGGTTWVRTSWVDPATLAPEVRGDLALVVAELALGRIGSAPVLGAVGRHERTLEIVLARSASVAGKVLTQGGAPLEGATVIVRLAGQRHGPPVWSAVTDAHGTFTVLGVRGDAFDLRAIARGYVSGTVRRAADQLDAVEFRLAPEERGSHALEVRLAGELPPLDVAVTLWSLDDPQRKPRTLELDAEDAAEDGAGNGAVVGSFRELPAGRYRVDVARIPGWRVDGLEEAVVVPEQRAVELAVEREELTRLRLVVEDDPGGEVALYGARDQGEFGLLGLARAGGEVLVPERALREPLFAALDGRDVVAVRARPERSPQELSLRAVPGRPVLVRLLAGGEPCAGVVASVAGRPVGLSDARGVVAVSFGALAEAPAPAAAVEVALTRDGALLGTVSVGPRTARTALSTFEVER